jgi:hypothetical protein
MKKYAVTKFGVDLTGNEVDELIWEGQANSHFDAIYRCLRERYEEKDWNFMQWYLKAHEYELN